MSRSVFTPAELVPSCLEQQYPAAGSTALDAASDNPSHSGLASCVSPSGGSRRQASTSVTADTPLEALAHFSNEVTAANLVARVTALRRRQREAARSHDALAARTAVPLATTVTERLGRPASATSMGSGAAEVLLDDLGVAYNQRRSRSRSSMGETTPSVRARSVGGLVRDRNRKSTCPSAEWPIRRTPHPERFAVINESRDFFRPSLRKVRPNYDHTMPPRPLSRDAAEHPPVVPLLAPVRPGIAGQPPVVLPIDGAKQAASRTSPHDAAHEAKTLLLAARALLA